MQTEAFGFKSSLGLGGSERVSERGASLLAPVCAPAGVTRSRARSSLGRRECRVSEMLNSRPQGNFCVSTSLTLNLSSFFHSLISNNLF